MKPGLISFVFLLLAGCGGTHSIREVNVPVIVPCVTSIPEEPSFPLQEASGSEDLFTLVKKSLSEIELRKGYELKLKSALTACVK